MKSILNALHNLEEAKLESPEKFLSREDISAAITQQRDLTAAQIREVMADRTIEEVHANLVQALIEEPRFTRKLRKGHVTFGMIKPNANEAHEKNFDRSDNEVAAEVLETIADPIQVLAYKHTHMPESVARQFYDNTRKYGEDVFEEIVEYMSSGAITALILYSENPDAIPQWRAQMGSTRPNEAAEGTIRRTFAEFIENNVVHGSDSPENAERELKLLIEML